MKNGLRKMLLLVFVVPQVAASQGTEPEFSTSVVIRDSNWGQVTRGRDYTITPSGFKEPPGPGEGAGIVVDPFRFEIRGTPGGATVALVIPESFSSDDSNGYLPLSHWPFYWGNDGDPWPAGALDDTVSVLIDSTGVGQLIVSSTVTVPSTAFLGGYTAQMRATYLDIDTVVYRTLVVVDVTDVIDPGGRPREFALNQNYPNPFNPVTTISYTIPSADHVTLTVFNVLGEVVTTVVNQVQEPGFYDVSFDAGNLPSGVYAYRLTAGPRSDIKKMQLIR